MPFIKHPYALTLMMPNTQQDASMLHLNTQYNPYPKTLSALILDVLTMHTHKYKRYNSMVNSGIVSYIVWYNYYVFLNYKGVFI